MARWVAFDRHGTLVDWNAGLCAVVGSAQLLACYPGFEPRVEAEGPWRSYRDVLRDYEQVP